MGIIVNPHGSFASQAFQDVVNKTRTPDQSPIAANFTFVQKYLTAGLSAGGGIVRVTLLGPAAGASTVISAMYVGLSATSGGAWDFAASPTQITFAGLGSVTLVAGSVATSDDISFNISGANAISIATNVTSGSKYRFGVGFGTNFIAYATSGVSEAATVDKGASYSATGGRINFISRIEAK